MRHSSNKHNQLTTESGADLDQDRDLDLNRDQDNQDQNRDQDRDRDQDWPLQRTLTCKYTFKDNTNQSCDISETRKINSPQKLHPQ